MTTPTAPGQPVSTTDLQKLLKEAPHRVWWRRMTVWIIVALLLLCGLGFYLWQANAERNAAPVYVTEPASKGNLTLTVAANGTIQPTRSVSIGSELSGTVLRVLVDVNDQIKKGQVLVELDTAKLNDQVARSRAALAAAHARVAQAVATVKEAQGNLGPVSYTHLTLPTIYSV